MDDIATAQHLADRNEPVLFFFPVILPFLPSDHPELFPSLD